MTPLIPCTVQILTRNSAASLPKCLATLTEFDEIIVQDGYSDDGTREAATKFPNVRILDQDKRFLNAEGRITDFASMRNESIRAAKYDWLLVVDADENVDPALVEEVRRIVSANVPGIYRAFRRFYVNGEKIMQSAGYPALQIRLFHRSLTDGYVKPVHERLKLHDGVPQLMLASELPVPLPPAAQLEPKYVRYAKMERERIGKAKWGFWLYWILFRNLRSIAAMLLRIANIWLIPRPGKRMPLAYEFQHVRYLLRVMWMTVPFRNKA